MPQDDLLLELQKELSRLQKRVWALETQETIHPKNFDYLNVGSPVTPTTTIGEMVIADKLTIEGQLVADYLNIGTPITPATFTGDAAIDGDLNVEGTITNSGMVTNGNTHDHIGGDGATITFGAIDSSISNGLVTNGNNHDHSGGDGGTIPESALATAVQNQLVTNGDTHNHIGGDGATISFGAIDSSISAGLVTNGNNHDHSGGDGGSIPGSAITNGSIAETKLQTAVQNMLVTNGDSHNHSGGDGASIPGSGITNDSITATQIAANAIGQSELASGAVATTHIVAGAVGTSQLASQAVDDTKAGNRVPYFYRRTGGSSSVWDTPGSSSFTPARVKMQGGSVTANGGADTTVTFPSPYSGRPLVLISLSEIANGGSTAWLAVWQVEVGFFVIHNTFGTSYKVHWLAIGPG